MTRTGWIARASALICFFTAARASAHLMQPEHATVNVVDDGVFSVVSIPASALHGADDDGDGKVSQAELVRHRTSLVTELSNRWILRDGPERASVVTLDLVLQPSDDAPADRADQVVMLHHARFHRTVSELGLDTDLFGSAPWDRSLTVAVTRRSRTEQTVLIGPRAEHAFFAVPPAPGPRHLGWDLALLTVVILVTLRVTRKRTEVPTYRTLQRIP